ncbi:MAG TPA: diguanylate cyclase [Dongiaceae bacterium]|nr:diguanylate cyclase [Dongiaceae bacterium]
MPLHFKPEDQQLLLASFEYAAIGAAIAADDGQWLKVNTALCNMLGYTDAYLLSTNCRTITHPDDIENDLHHLDLLRDGDLRNCTLEKRYRCQDGTYLWVRVNMVITRQEKREDNRFVLLVQDINEEREHLLQIRRNARRLEEIVTTQGQLANVQLDLSRFMTTVSERMQAITPATGAVVELVEGDKMVYRAASGSMLPFVGKRLKIASSLSGLCVQKREVLRSDDTSCDPRVDAEACKAVGAGSMIVAPLIHNGEAVGVLKVMAKDAHVFSDADLQTLQLMAGLLGSAMAHQLDFETKESLLRDRNRTVEALQTEMDLRNRYETHLRATEARTRRIIEASLDAFVSINHAGIITEWNPQAEKTFGWTRDEVMGRPMAGILIPAGMRDAHTAGLVRYNQTGVPVMLDQRIQANALTRDRGEIPVEMTISAVEVDGHQQFHAFLHDITERKKNEARLQQMAQHDQLTGLPNRNLFFDRLEGALARNQRHKDWMALMYLDVDRFKQVNDTLGHAAGDLLLQAFSARIFTAIRASDTLARLGGDEFTLIAEGMHSPKDAEDLAAKIVALAAGEFVLEDQIVHVGTSIGVALVNGQKIDPDTLLEHADKALYAAKKAGRNGYRIA